MDGNAQKCIFSADLVFFALPTWLGMPKHVFSARIYNVFCIANMDGNAQTFGADLWCFSHCQHGRECPQMHFQRGSIVFFELSTWTGVPKLAFSARIYSVFCIVNMDGNAQTCIFSADLWCFVHCQHGWECPNVGPPQAPKKGPGALRGQK